MSTQRNTLGKSEILRKGRILDSLFLPKESITIPNFIARHSYYESCIKCKYMFRSNEKLEEEPLQAMFSVPKRNFRRAVKRNKYRRRMKESYRLSKFLLKELAQEKKVAITVHFTYATNKEMEYNSIDDAIKIIIKEISDKLTSCVD